MPYGTIGQAIRHFRIKNKLSQVKLAERIGVANSTLSQYESGKITPPIRILQKLSLELSCPVQLLIQHRLGILG
jgi:repressor LexA